MGTFIPVWVIQDVLVYAMSAVLILYIVKKEPHPLPILMEIFCFVLLYASVYENAATAMKMYGYGRSLIMVLNVPLSIPFFEFWVLYCSLKLMERMQLPAWNKPIIAGFLAVIADFSLDPVSVKQIYATAEGTIGRWTWFINAQQPQIYNEPVYNFTGWMYIVGYAALFIVLGRWWYQKSHYSSVVGYVYPVLAALGGLLLLFSPITLFTMFGEPFGAKGSNSEWVMLALTIVVPLVLLASCWRGRMLSRFSLKDEWPLFAFLCGFPLINLLFCIIGGFWQIFWLVLLASVVMWALAGAIYLAATRVANLATPDDIPTKSEAKPEKVAAE